MGLFSDRTSCHDWWANQFRLLVSSCAYVLLEAVRRWGLVGTELARAQAGTIRLKLHKIGAVVLRNTRRVRLLLSSSYPYQKIYPDFARRLLGFVIKPPQKLRKESESAASPPDSLMRLLSGWVGTGL